MRQPSITVLNNLVFALALGILALLAWQGKQTQEALLWHNDAERASLELIALVQGMMSALQDVETGARGYVLTGSAVYLEPYVGGRRRLAKERDGLGRALLARHPGHARWLAALDRDVAARLSVSERIVAERRRAGMEPAAALVASAGGKEIMDRLRAQLGSVEAAERARLRDASAAAERQYTRGRRQLVLGGLVVGLLLAGALLALNQNLRERSRLARQAQAERGFLRSVIDTDENLIFVRDESGRFTLCNRAFGLLLDEWPGAIEGKPVDFVKGAHRVEALLDGDAGLLAGDRDLECEVRTVDATGREQWWELHKQVIALPDGTRAVLAVAGDISVRRQLDRMKSEFVSTVSHELRTPLTAIRGALGMVMGGMAGDLPEASIPLLTIADKNSTRLVSLINDILDIEKLDAGRFELDPRAMPVRDLLQQAVEQNTPYATHYGVTLALAGDTDAIVEVDPDRFAQVMANLLSNAVKHSPRQGEVVVDAACRNGVVEIGVRDHGMGIPLEFQPRLFQRFAQADASDARRRGGTGLGLAITQGLVEQHGGEIGFETTPGIGTRFHVRLPAADGLAAPAASSPEEGARILILDDDEESAPQLAGILASSGYVPVVAGSTARAWTLLADVPVRGVVVSMALRDEDALGYIAALRSHASYRHLPVLAVVVQSANDPGASGNVGAEGAAIGIGDWLRKPFDAPRVVEAVRASIDGTGHRPQVLHVEDDTDLRALVASLLAPERLDLHGAGSLAEARAALAVRRHDLVILDLILPDGDGAMLLDELAAARPSPRVIIFSARDTDVPESTVVMQRLVKSRQGAPELASLIREQLNHWPRPSMPPKEGTA